MWEGDTEDTIRRSLEGQFPQVMPDNFHSRQQNLPVCKHQSKVRTKDFTGLEGSCSTRRKASKDYRRQAFTAAKSPL